MSQFRDEEITIRLKVTKNSPEWLKDFADAVLERSYPDWTKNISGWTEGNKRAVSKRGRAVIEHFMKNVEIENKVSRNNSFEKNKNAEHNDDSDWS